MTFNNKSGVDALARITAGRNKMSVEQSVLKNIFELIQCECLFLLRINHARGDGDVVSVFPKEAVPSPGFDLFFMINEGIGRTNACDVYIDLKVIIQSKSFFIDLKNKIALIPCVVSHNLTDVICIYGYESAGTNQAVLTGVASVYADFVSVLEENERDTLTGLLNRKTFDERLADLSRSIDSIDEPLVVEGDKRSGNKVNNDRALTNWVGVLDIDFFKKINDGFGHLYGDEVLLLFSDLMRKVFRNNDLLFRFGGEEFVVFLLHVDEKGAFFAFERFRRELEEFEFPQVGKVTVSIGLTKVNQGDHSATLLDQADKALYYAKEHGRNQVCNYHELLKLGEVVQSDTSGDIDLF